MNSEDYGWMPEAEEWYQSTLGKANDPKAEIWQTIQATQNSFQSASWWLAKKSLIDSEHQSLGYRRQIRLLVSKEETHGSFPFTQYIRELCQNALDARFENEILTIDLSLINEKLTFSHNGRTFTAPKPDSPDGEMASLYAPGATTKKGSFNSEGRFGIGFKGWMLFFREILHAHSNGSEKIQIGYRWEGDTLPKKHLCLKGPEHQDNIDAGSRTTSFTFTLPTDDFVLPSIQEIIQEWEPMIRFAPHGVIINLDVNGEVAQLKHEYNSLGNTEHTILDQELFESTTITDLSNLHLPRKFNCTNYENNQECGVFDYEGPIEVMPDCPTCHDNDTVIRNENVLNDENSRFMFECTWNGEENCGEFEHREPLAESDLATCPSCESLDEVSEIITEPITTEKIIGVNSLISSIQSIKDAVTGMIDDERKHYDGVENQEINPWATVTPENWFEQKRLTCGISLNENIDNRPWLFSMAEITSANLWPSDRFFSSSNWMIDGPFFLDATRKNLKSDELANHANAAMMSFALSQCIPYLAHRLYDEELLERLNESTPFDVMFDDEWRDTDNPFEAIVYNESENETSRGNVRPIDYHTLFSGKPIFCNSKGKMINANTIRRIPDSWRLETNLSFAQWLQEKTAILADYFDFIPYSTDQQNQQILNESNTPFTLTIPEINTNRLYQILADADLIEELTNSFPTVVSKDWYQFPIDEELTSFIFGQVPQGGELIELMKSHALDSTIGLFDENNQHAKKFNQKKPKWVEIEGYHCLTASPDATEAWWFDRLMERIIRDNIVISDEDIETMALMINEDPEISYFVATAKALFVNNQSNRSSLGLSSNGTVILPRKLDYISNWTIMANTLTAWNKRQVAGAGLTLWRQVSEDSYSPITCNKEIYIPTGESEYFCEDENCSGVFVPGEQYETGTIPDCPDCESAVDVLYRRNSPLVNLMDCDFFVMMEEPINSSKTLELTIDAIQKSNTSLRFVESAIMLVSPNPVTENLVDQLKSENWTKIPTISMTNHRDSLPSEMSYNDQGYYNQNSDLYVRDNWAGTESGINRFIAPFYANFYGHGLNLHERNRYNKQTNVLIREIGQRELISHGEWDRNGELCDSTRLITQINQTRSSNFNSLSVSFVRLDRRTSKGEYLLKRASVRTTRQRTPVFDKDELIPYEESQSLTNLGMCGFSEPQYPNPSRGLSH